jgi:hypothetical protein
MFIDALMVQLSFFLYEHEVKSWAICQVCLYVYCRLSTLVGMAIVTGADGNILSLDNVTTGVAYTTDLSSAAMTTYGPFDYNSTSEPVVQMFLQTAGAKAIAGVFSVASIIVTCIQVSFVFSAAEETCSLLFSSAFCATVWICKGLWLFEWTLCNRCCTFQFVTHIIIGVKISC